MKRLTDILPAYPGVADLRVRDLRTDSRQVTRGDLFIAVEGDRFDGRQFIAAAQKSGAAAALSEPGYRQMDLDASFPVIEVPGLRAELGRIADRFYDGPSHRCRVIAVTGTNGKTSCTHFVARALGSIGRRCGVVGTLGYGDPDDLTALALTTPDVVELHRIIARLVARDLGTVALEASSHGLAQGRLDAVEVKVAVFLNITRDHLDYHGDFDGYKAAKRLLFQLPSVEWAVLNAEDEFSREIAAGLPDRVRALFFSERDTDADVACLEAEFEAGGIRATCRTPHGDIAVNAPVYGRFNLGNLLAVIGVLAVETGSRESLERALAHVRGVRGRMERLSLPDDRTVFIDYAHTPDALEQSLAAIRDHFEREAVCLFGCGGDRDKGKRSLMGQVAGERAKRLVVTSDNPRFEEPRAIIDDILEGIGEGVAVTVEEDRERAIHGALDDLAGGEVLLIAGKGHETYQEVKGARMPFSDHVVVAGAL